MLSRAASRTSISGAPIDPSSTIAGRVAAVADGRKLTADQVKALIDNGHTRLVLDMKNIRYAGSAALGMLLAIAQRMKAKGGKLVLSHPETVAELLRISKTERMFTTAPDPKAAMAMLE